MYNYNRVVIFLSRATYRVRRCFYKNDFVRELPYRGIILLYTNSLQYCFIDIICFTNINTLVKHICTCTRVHLCFYRTHSRSNIVRIFGIFIHITLDRPCELEHNFIFSSSIYRTRR